MLRARTSRRDGGFTLVELLVVLLVFGVIGTIVMRATVASFQTTSRGQDRILALSDLQKGLERISREIRVARTLYVDTTNPDDCLGALVERDGKTVYYVYRLADHDADGDRDELLEDRQTFSTLGADPATDTATGTSLGTFIDETANETEGVALFRYYDTEGDGVDATDSNDLITTAQVEVTLMKQLDDGRPPLKVMSRVNVRASRFTDGTIATTTCT